MTDRPYLCQVDITSADETVGTGMWKWVLDATARDIAFHCRANLALFARSPEPKVRDALERLKAIDLKNMNSDSLDDLGKVGIFVVSIELLSAGDPICSVADGESVTGLFETEFECRRMRDVALANGIGESSIECMYLMD